MPVHFGDTLSLADSAEWKPIPIQWRQLLRSYEKKYYRVDFRNTRDDPEKSGVLFVSEERLEDFKNYKIQSGDSGMTIKVDSEFVYGQQEGGTHRFLVYHDQDRNIYQHRFLEGVMNVGGPNALDVLLARNQRDDFSEFIAGTVGDPLRTF